MQLQPEAWFACLIVQTDNYLVDSVTKRMNWTPTICRLECSYNMQSNSLLCSFLPLWALLIRVTIKVTCKLKSAVESNVQWKQTGCCRCILIKMQNNMISWTMSKLIHSCHQNFLFFTALTVCKLASSGWLIGSNFTAPFLKTFFFSLKQYHIVNNSIKWKNSQQMQWAIWTWIVMTHVSSRLTMSWCVYDLALSCRYRRMCCSTLSVHIAYTQVFTCMQTARNSTTVTIAEHYNLTVRKNMVNPAIEHASSPYELVSQAQEYLFIHFCTSKYPVWSVQLMQTGNKNIAWVHSCA